MVKVLLGVCASKFMRLYAVCLRTSDPESLVARPLRKPYTTKVAFWANFFRQFPTHCYYSTPPYYPTTVTTVLLYSPLLSYHYFYTPLYYPTTATTPPAPIFLPQLLLSTHPPTLSYSPTATTTSSAPPILLVLHRVPIWAQNVPPTVYSLCGFCKAVSYFLCNFRITSRKNRFDASVKLLLYTVERILVPEPGAPFLRYWRRTECKQLASFRRPMRTHTKPKIVN